MLVRNRNERYNTHLHIVQCTIIENNLQFNYRCSMIVKVLKRSYSDIESLVLRYVGSLSGYLDVMCS